MAMAQQPESADFDQMPSSAIATGLVDYVLTPEKMPEALINYVRQPYLTNDPAEAPGTANAPDLLNRILVLLRIRTRYDFRCYRKNMLMRRVLRRMGLWQIKPLADYLELLRENPDEVLALYKDLLIGVTSFFRDPEAFQVLEQRVIPDLVARNRGNTPVRVWVPGCATGEEAYSIAILVLERFSEIKSTPNLQIFASDLDDEALRFARAGIYPTTIAGDLSPERLRRFFNKADDHSYQVNKRLRESVVFAPQNLIGDAPFSKLDLVSCRNLLIYLEPEIQKKILSLFHFALNADGFLMLGPSETVGRQVDLFTLVSARWRVYRRTGPTRRGLVEIPIDSGVEWRLPAKVVDTSTRNPPSLADVMQKQLLAEYAPASVLISRKFEVLCF
jgi:two-component system CheB/CheR fusion protein